MPAALGIDIPTASYWIGVLALTAASMLLFALGRLQGQPLIGFIAALVLLAFPLSWLTMGFETPLFTAVALVAFVMVVRARPVLAGIAGGIAMGLRGDGVIVVGLLAIGCWLLPILGKDALAGSQPNRFKPAIQVLVASALTRAMAHVAIRLAATIDAANQIGPGGVWPHRLLRRHVLSRGRGAVDPGLSAADAPVRHRTQFNGLWRHPLWARAPGTATPPQQRYASAMAIAGCLGRRALRGLYRDSRRALSVVLRAHVARRSLFGSAGH